MRPESVTASVNPNFEQRDDSIVFLELVCDNARSCDDLRHILESGPVQITRLAPLTTEEIDTHYNELLKAISQAHRDGTRNILEDSDLPDSEKLNDLHRLGNNIAEQLLSTYEWKFNQLQRLEEEQAASTAQPDDIHDSAWHAGLNDLKHVVAECIDHVAAADYAGRETEAKVALMIAFKAFREGRYDDIRKAFKKTTDEFAKRQRT